MIPEAPDAQPEVELICARRENNLSKERSETGD